MVPGSTLRYPSHLTGTILSREERRCPMDAAAIPFPRPERTPPVTIMYLVAISKLPKDFGSKKGCSADPAEANRKKDYRIPYKRLNTDFKCNMWFICWKPGRLGNCMAFSLFRL